MLMCIQNLVKFCPLVLKILSGNEMVTELRNYGITEGQGKSNIAPLFQSGAIIKGLSVSCIFCEVHFCRLCSKLFKTIFDTISANDGISCFCEICQTVP